MARFIGPLTRYVRSHGKTLKYEFAVAAFGVWIGVTLRIFLSADPVWIAAQGVNYATLTTTVWLFITASVITQVVQNSQAAESPPTSPIEPTIEDTARSVP